MIRRAALPSCKISLSFILFCGFKSINAHIIQNGFSGIIANSANKTFLFVLYWSGKTKLDLCLTGVLLNYKRQQKVTVETRYTKVGLQLQLIIIS